jgi:hypothetical protein
MDARVKSATLSGIDGRVLEETAVAELGEATAVIAALVPAARERAAQRLAGTPWRVNAEIPRDEKPTRGDCAAALGLRIAEIR